MSKFTQTLCILFAFVSLFSNATGSRTHPGLHASVSPYYCICLYPENPPSCDSIKFKINDCSPYLRKHSSMAEPGTSCCLGLMDAWKDNSDCSDQVFKSIVNLRHVNATRLTHVSSTCGFSDISLDDYLEESLVVARVSADQAKTDKDMEDEAYKDVPYKVVVVSVVVMVRLLEDVIISGRLGIQNGRSHRGLEETHGTLGGKEDLSMMSRVIVWRGVSNDEIKKSDLGMLNCGNDKRSKFGFGEKLEKNGINVSSFFEGLILSNVSPKREFQYGRGHKQVLDEFSPAKEFFVWLGSGCLANVVMSFFLYGVSGRMRWSSELVSWLLLSIF
ncbi:non-specific lipid-transfer protein-like protein isoform X2 [Tanacetum coccineum]